jgi:hypothetical protein
MFSGPLWIVLATWVIFNQATRAVENKKKDFNYVIQFDNETNNDGSLKTKSRHPDTVIVTNTSRLDETAKLKIRQTHPKEEQSKVSSYINSIIASLIKRITDFISSFLSTTCEQLGEKRANDEVCLCKNSTVLYYITRNVCFLIKINVTNIAVKHKL